MTNHGPTLMQTLGLKGPLIVAPMAGGPSTPELVAAVSQSGALGSIGAAYLKGSELRSFADALRQKSVQRFAINLFIAQPEPRVTPEQLSRALAATAGFRRELALPPPPFQAPYALSFDEQFEAMLSIKPAVFSFIFGELPSVYRDAAKRAHIFLMGTATSLEEALRLEASGVDAVILQGIEAGGHRGIFDAHAPDPAIPIWDLLASCAKSLKIPLIASGGIMNGHAMHEAVRRGAQAVQMGTAFLACKEAGTSSPYRKALLASAERKSRCTRVFSGRLARGIENRFMNQMEQTPEAILPFPAQNSFTRDIRNAAAAQGSTDFLSLWSGTGQAELWTDEASALVKNLFAEYREAQAAT